MLTLVAATEAVHAEKVRVSYGALTSANLPLWLPYEMKLFKKDNMDVELIKVSSNVAIAALVSGDLDVADANAFGLINAALSGADLVMVAARTTKLAGSLFVGPSINSVEDLKGKVVGISRHGSFSDFATRYLLRAYNLKPSQDVAMVQYGDGESALLSLHRGSIQGTVMTGLDAEAEKLGL